jgi:hypothetical protein
MVSKDLPSSAMATATTPRTKYKLAEGVEPEEVARLLRAEDIGTYHRILGEWSSSAWKPN